MLGDVVEHLKGVVEHLLVTVSVACLYTLHCCELWKYDFEQAATVEFYESLRWYGREQNLVQLVVDSLA